MFTIKTGFGNRWAVIDGEGETMCRGTKHQCEDWLDFQDNKLPAGSLPQRPLAFAPSLRELFLSPVRQLCNNIADLALVVRRKVFGLNQSISKTAGGPTRRTTRTNGGLIRSEK